MSRTPQDFHQLAEEMAEKGRGCLDALLDENPETVDHKDAMLATAMGGAYA